MAAIRNAIVVSDLHAGCRLGLCPPEGAKLDDGGSYFPSVLQEGLYSWWKEFWHEWVPMVTRNEPFCVVLNGDALDGVHHNSTTQVSHNLQDQAEIAYQLLAPIVDLSKGKYYHLRGTEAHSGPSGVEEERLAQRLGAIPNEEDQHARYDLWLRVGEGRAHILHTIGSSGSQFYESTAPQKELIEEFAEAGRWREDPPDCIARSHRHRHIEVRVPTANGYGIVFITAAWQLRTPYAWKLAGARLSPPQIGGSLIRYGDEDGIYTRHFVKHLARSKEERP